MNTEFVPRAPETVRSDFLSSLSAKLEPFAASDEVREKLRFAVQEIADLSSLEATRFVRRVLSECHALQERPVLDPPMEFVRVVSPRSMVLKRETTGTSIVKFW